MIECVHTLEGYKTRVTSVAISPDGQIIASGSFDTTIKLWNLNTGELLQTLYGKFRNSWGFESVAFSPDGQIIAGGFNGSTLEKGQEPTPDSDESTIQLWNPRTGESLGILSGHLGSVVSLAFSPDGQTLASGSHDKTIKIWDLDNGNLIRHIEKPVEMTYVRGLVMCPDGKTIISNGGYDDGKILIWDLLSGKLVRKLSHHCESGRIHIINRLAVSADGQILFSSNGQEIINIWNLNSGKLLGNIPLSDSTLWSLALSPDGQTLAAGTADKNSNKNERIKIWRLEKRLGMIKGREIGTGIGHSETIGSVAFSPDGQTLVSGSTDKTVKIWRLSYDPSNPEIANQSTFSIEKIYGYGILAGGIFLMLIGMWLVGLPMVVAFLWLYFDHRLK